MLEPAAVDYVSDAHRRDADRPSPNCISKPMNFDAAITPTLAKHIPLKETTPLPPERWVDSTQVLGFLHAGAAAMLRGWTSSWLKIEQLPGDPAPCLRLYQRQDNGDVMLIRCASLPLDGQLTDLNWKILP